MAASNLTPGERRRVDFVLRTITEPAAALLLDRHPEIVHGMKTATVQNSIVPLMSAAVEIQAGGVQPTDAAFEEYGGPKRHSVGRVLRAADFSDLPATQLRRAMDAQFVAAPERLVVEARTEATKGPAKFGGVHVNPPPGMEGLVGRKPGVPHTTGGIASAFALADCGDVVHPFGEVPIQQGLWHPDAWAGHDRATIEDMLRDAGGFHGHATDFIRTPEEVARRMIERMRAVERLCAWNVRFDGFVIVGGCLRVGFPDPTASVYGGSRESRYIGGNLAALHEIRNAGHVGFFELPQRARGTGRPAAGEGMTSDWSLRIGDELLDLPAVEELLYAPDSPWKLVDPTLVARVAGAGTRAWRLAARATNGAVGELDVQLVFMTDDTSRTDLYVSTMAVPPSEVASEEQLMRLAAEESGRRLRDSKVELSMRGLLEDGWALRNQRRFYPDRRGLAAIAQTALGVLEIVRHGAC